jgi:Lrp/AsnC family transcriptional regulator of ectoine degradation
MGYLPKLDFLDIKILRALSRNARMTKTRMSEEVGLSATPCHERIKKLEKSKIIRGYHVDIDYQKLTRFEFYIVEVYIKKEYSLNKHHIFQRTIQNIPDIIQCHSVLGRVDYLMIVAARSIDHYRAIMDDLVSHDSFEMDYVSYPVSSTIKSSQSAGIIDLIYRDYREIEA